MVISSDESARGVTQRTKMSPGIEEAGPASTVVWKNVSLSSTGDQQGIRCHLVTV